MKDHERSSLPISQAGAANAGNDAANTVAQVIRIVLCGAAMICCSAGVINFNKYLMSGPFPYASYLVLGHMGFGSCLSVVLFTVAPSLYPSLSDPHQKVRVSLDLVVFKVLPIALFFAGSLVLSNMAYLYANVAFLQMMKQANVVLVYVVSLAVGLESFRLRNIGVLLFILVGTTLNIAGEMKLSLLGVFLQGLSQVFEVARLILQSMLLGGKGIKLDVLTYNLIVMPMCFTALATFISIQAMFPDMFSANLKPPSWQEIVTHRYLLLANMCSAFVLNVSIALFIKFSSAISMVLANVLKDIFVVVCSVVVLKDAITMWQTCGFVIQLIGVFTWSMLKTFQQHFEKGILAGFVELFMVAFSKNPIAEMAQSHILTLGKSQGYRATANADSAAGVNRVSD